MGSSLGISGGGGLSGGLNSYPWKSIVGRLGWDCTASFQVVQCSPNPGPCLNPCSASEMRSIMSEQFGALALPVAEFLAREHKVWKWGVEGKFC